MSSRSIEYRPSPLDGAMRRFLMALPSVTSPIHSREVSDLAAALDVPAAFVEALFLSARRRGLIRPEPFGRGKYVWNVTRQGEIAIELIPTPSTPVAGPGLGQP